MKLMTRLALIFLASGIVPWHSCDAGDGTVTGDTRYKYSQSDKSSDSTKEVRTVKTRTTHRVAPRWRRSGTHWYYSRAGEIPWWPSAPGD